MPARAPPREAAGRAGRPWRWLLLLALPAACPAPPPPRAVYTNHWAVQVRGGRAEADRVAAAHGYRNLGPVSAAPRAPRTVGGDPGGDTGAATGAAGRLAPPAAPAALSRALHGRCGAPDPAPGRRRADARRPARPLGDPCAPRPWPGGSASVPEPPGAAWGGGLGGAVGAHSVGTERGHGRGGGGSAGQAAGGGTSPSFQASAC